MGVRPILLWPDVRLCQPCAAVERITDETRALVADLFETMYAAPGRGLAAPQVGVLSRVFVMDATWKEGERTPIAFINPEIVAQSNEVVTQDEGCLSIPGIQTPIARPASVTLRWADIDGLQYNGSFTGFAAACVQHEYDHLDGCLTLDRLTDAARAEAEARLTALT